MVTVNPLPVVSFTVCFDEVTTTDAQPIRLKGGIPAGGSYSGAGVSGTIFYPGLAGAGSHTLTYAYTNTFSCPGNSSLSITVLSPMPFTCGNSLTDIRDSKVYPTVQIGTQCWMADNLNYGTQIPGASSMRDNCIPEKQCFNDLPALCAQGSALYQWDELMRYHDQAAAQGFCPPGWHIPTESEWTTLFNFYISSGFAGSPLKYSGYSGFNALLNGVRFNQTTWDFNSFATLFWSSTSHGPGKAWAHGMNDYNPSVSYYPSARSNAFPVRCIKD
jgi:uncharacterized protein (TIGR02145 family)